MSDPSSTGQGGGGVGQRNGSARSGVNQMAYCHECGIEIRPLMTPGPTCPRCSGSFVEVIESEEDHPRDFDRPDFEGGFGLFGGPIPAGAEAGGGGADVNALLQNLLGSMMAGAGGARPRREQTTESRPERTGEQAQQRSADAEGSEESRDRSRAGAEGGEQAQRRTGSNANTNAPSGSSDRPRVGIVEDGRYGYFYRFNYGEREPAAEDRPAAANMDDEWEDEEERAHVTPEAPEAQGRTRREESGQRQPQGEVPTLSSFLQSAFAGSQERAEGGLGSAAAREREEARARSFDDGMGGAGGAGDGRHFNHDNPDSDGDGRREPHFIGGGVGGLPPELAGLRELFTGIFGGAGGEGPQFFFPGMPGGGGGAGGRGGMQWGDYVFGQQGIDDIITQLMEQANGRSGAPPASDEAIAKLERFKLSDVERVSKGRNRDCPTCKEDFLPSSSAPQTPRTERSETDDPPERPAEDPQQEELVSMPCGHIYHEDCLVPWLKTNATCPVCRYSIAEEAQAQEGDGAGASSPSAENGAAASGNQTGPTSTLTSTSSGTDFPGAFPFLDSSDPAPAPASASAHSGAMDDLDAPSEEVRARAREAAESRASASASARQVGNQMEYEPLD